MWFVYILFCDQKMFYVGISQNVQQRLLQHKTGKSQFTKQFSDLKLVYVEKGFNKKSAEIREKQLKGWSRAKKKALINGDKEMLISLSKSTELVEVRVG